MCCSKGQNHDDCRDTLTLHRTPSYPHKKTTETTKDTQKKHRDLTQDMCVLSAYLGVLLFNIKAYFCISASFSLVESEMDN